MFLILHLIEMSIVHPKSLKVGWFAAVRGPPSIHFLPFCFPILGPITNERKEGKGEERRGGKERREGWKEGGQMKKREKMRESAPSPLSSHQYPVSWGCRARENAILML